MDIGHWHTLIGTDSSAVYLLTSKSCVDWPYVRIKNDLCRFVNLPRPTIYSPIPREMVLLKLNDAALELLKDPTYDLREE